MLKGKNRRADGGWQMAERTSTTRPDRGLAVYPTTAFRHPPSMSILEAYERRLSETNTETN
jgi:hypothetical protein